MCVCAMWKCTSVVFPCRSMFEPPHARPLVQHGAPTAQFNFQDHKLVMKAERLAPSVSVLTMCLHDHDVFPVTVTVHQHVCEISTR